MKTTSLMQTLSGLSGRLSQGESDFTLPREGRAKRWAGSFQSAARLSSPQAGSLSYGNT